MQLSKIKLAGFKSFVDPTTVLLPSNLVAVVGPNGCGKSNIIDAITWVMGESSAKYLRGELLTDVIFNGSTSRKPIGQASVELVFDNSDGSLGGEYSQYSEISIKRQITRAADSSYFLNGTRCRRKDIIDIFLGTGLGPRSYSIIGQNMIARIIEAKPDDMRTFLEEAAGVSKYKERRRETENRIQHTKDNLARLNDVRAELEKQISTLQRQANAAERYKILKQEERDQRGQSMAVQWRQLDGRHVQFTLQVQQQETGLEAKQAEFVNLDLSLEKKREEQHLATEAFHEIQKNYYTAGSEITRMEQEIRHHQERKQQRETDLAILEHDLESLSEQRAEMDDQVRELASEVAELQPAYETAKADITAASRELTEAETTSQNWQTQWDDFNQRAAKASQSAQVEQTRIQHLEQRLSSIRQRQERLTEEQTKLQFDDMETEIAGIATQASEAVAAAQEKETHLRLIKEKIAVLVSSQQKTTTQLDQVRNTLQKVHGQQAALEALQKTALGQRNNRQVEWLAKHNLDKKSRLAQGIEVDAGWENAVETVLGSYLQAVCVDDIAAVAETASGLQQGSLTLFSEHAGEHQKAAGLRVAQSNLPDVATLLSKVRSRFALDSLMSGIYIADSLAAALTLADTLAPNESVITPAGVWLSASWLRLSREENPAAGIFQREQELKTLQQQHEEHSKARAELETAQTEIREQIKQLEMEREHLQKTLNQSQVQAAQIQTREKMQRERLTDLKRRAEGVVQELKECVTQSEQSQGDLKTARGLWQEALTELENQTATREKLIAERDDTRNQLQTARTSLNTVKDHAASLQIRIQTAQSQQGALQQSLTHMQTQMDALSTRRDVLQEELNSAASITELEKTLSVSLERRLMIETELNTARETSEQLEQELRSFETHRQQLEREMGKIRDILETLRLESQGVKVKAENLQEQIQELGLLIEEVLQQIPADTSVEAIQTQLEQTVQRINRLGAINLVAIEEYATCSERKEYLDRQYDDLQEGLNTLEAAIAKIDKETRARFKETFETVNQRFQELFPSIFGGGRAYLEMTGENLLDAGISVMACPPGKRNSTIHLLSGGEKALTAIALIFSIFHLNPAPFCLLDEVDAPLDDANVLRFCNLLKTMAEKTQFIFISHNKLAIEMAHHLMGVTMHEPGVSRLVSVNVEEAITLAGA